jgi:hypothetical protein
MLENNKMLNESQEAEVQEKRWQELSRLDTSEVVKIWLNDLLEKYGKTLIGTLTKNEINAEIVDAKYSLAKDKAAENNFSVWGDSDMEEYYEEYLEVLYDLFYYAK